MSAQHPGFSSVAVQQSAAVHHTPVKKADRPQLKSKIPGTDWQRITTTQGHVFYFNAKRRESVWTIPEEIRKAAEAFDKRERLGDHETDEGQLPKHSSATEVVLEAGKRKVEDAEFIDKTNNAKKRKSAKEDAEEINEESGAEVEWECEASAQLAQETQQRKEAKKEELWKKELERDDQDRATFTFPDKVELSVEEAKALFKTLLIEKDIDPLHPWDKSLPKFISDPRYVLLSSVTARREVFDEYCQDRVRERRQLSMKDKIAPSAREAFDILLQDEVHSTRITWSEFRRTWKKDRRFYDWGRDDRDREKRFRSFLKDLGEKKREAAQKTETDFFTLLREKLDIRNKPAWKDVKRGISTDPRYDAVGSSSLREELYQIFLKGSEPKPAAGNNTSRLAMEEETKNGKRERKERAIKEREEKVKAERGRLQTDIERSRAGINLEEGRNEFNTLLVDAIRDPQDTWETALVELQTDARFTQSPLPFNQKIYLFHLHIAHIRSKYRSALHTLFESNAPSLATAFDKLHLESLLSSLPVTKLGLDIRDLENEFDIWQRDRTEASRRAFNDMLAENSFVEFWGRLGKIGGEGVDSMVQVDNDDIGEEEAEGVPKVDMKALAKNVDIKDMVNVLKGDKRYIMFDHVPEKRERWLRDYLSTLPPPKLSVHIPS